MAGTDGRLPSGTLSSKQPGSDNRLALMLGAIALTLLVLSASGLGDGAFGALRTGFNVITTPIRQLGSLAGLPFQGVGNAVLNLTADQKTLSDLQQENELLAARNAELEEAEQTAQRLEELLGVQSSYNLQSIGARVIALSTSSWQSTLTIDKGAGAGLAVGMPVISVAGVLGQIVECYPTSSVVALLNDENSSVSAMVQASRAQGMLVGAADGSLRLSMVGTDQQVAVGDTVVTSGLGGVYPKGLPLGKVSSVERNNSQIYLEIGVSAFASATTNEEVLVVTSLTDEQKASADEVMQANAQDAAQAQQVVPATDATTGEAGQAEAQGAEEQAAEGGEQR